MSSRNLLKIVCFAFALAIVAPASSFAQGRGKPSAESYYKKGKKAYTLGHFDDAIAEFEKAYEIEPEPIFIFNIAQSHKQNGNYQRALFFYRRYLQEAPGANDRAEVEEKMRALEAQLAEKSAAPKPISPPPTSATVNAPQPPEHAPSPLMSGPSSPPPVAAVPSNPGRGLIISGIVVGSAGVATIVGGILAGAHASSLHDDVTCTGCTFDSGKDSSSSTYRTLSYVAYGVGGAAVGTGAALLILGATAKDNAPVAFTPWFGAGTTGAAFNGRF
jgi:tetratricopeptide (TPR) repeat protein